MEDWSTGEIMAAVSLMVVTLGLIIVVLKVVWNISGWTTEVDRDRKDFTGFIQRVEPKIEKIFGYFSTRVFIGNSPLGLTEFGKSISDHVDGKRWAEEHAPSLAESIQGKTHYDIQAFCFEYMETFEPSHDQNMKWLDCAFEQGIDIEVVRKVLAVELRDMILHSLPPNSTPRS